MDMVDVVPCKRLLGLLYWLDGVAIVLGKSTTNSRHHGPRTIHQVGLNRSSLLASIRAIGDEVPNFMTVEASLAIVDHLPSAILLSLDITLALIGRVGLVQCRCLSPVLH